MQRGEVLSQARARGGCGQAEAPLQVLVGACCVAIGASSCWLISHKAPALAAPELSKTSHVEPLSQKAEQPSRWECPPSLHGSPAPAPCDWHTVQCVLCLDPTPTPVPSSRSRRRGLDPSPAPQPVLVPVSGLQGQSPPASGTSRGGRGRESREGGPERIWRLRPEHVLEAREHAGEENRRENGHNPT